MVSSNYCMYILFEISTHTGMEFLSTGNNGLEMWYENSMLHIRAQTTTNTWELETDNPFTPNQWQFMEVSWDPITGLKFYMNNTLLAESNNKVFRSLADSQAVNPDYNRIYIGKGSGRRANMRFGNFTIDHLKYWSGNRDYLIAHDFIQRGIPMR